ncbi:hypothetical protein D3C81_1948880 [compost metagenome]
MIDDKIGTIGSTHGVKARPRPSNMNRGTMTSSLPPFSAASILPISLCAGAALAATGAAATGSGVLVISAWGMLITDTPGDACACGPLTAAVSTAGAAGKANFDGRPAPGALLWPPPPPTSWAVASCGA